MPYYERARREIQARKFYGTLKYKLDKAEREYLEKTKTDEPTSEFTEVVEGETPLGGMMRRKRINN